LEVDDIAKTPSRRFVTYLVGAGAEVHGIGRISPARAAIVLPLTARDIGSACNKSSTTTDDGRIRRDGDGGIGVDGNRISSRPGTAAISDIDGVSRGATDACYGDPWPQIEVGGMQAGAFDGLIAGNDELVGIGAAWLDADDTWGILSKICAVPVKVIVKPVASLVQLSTTRM